MGLLQKKDTKFENMTLTEFDKLPRDEQERYEFVGGMVMMPPKATLIHQLLITNLIIGLGPYFKGKTCKVFSEAEIKLKNDIFIPDISILCDPDKFSEQRYEGPPAVAIEVLSPATRSYDLFTKLNKYQMTGVKEYWIVDPKSQTITVHRFEISEADIYIRGEALTTPLFEGLELAMDDIFAS